MHIKSKNISYLEDLLTIKNLGTESIHSVVDRMEILLNIFKVEKKYNSFVPFLTTYYLVTQAVLEKREHYKEYFQNPKAIERLDVYFAHLFFDPLKNFLLKGSYTKPWETYYRYTKIDTHPFVCMLLGINAHINGDLAVALYKTNYTNKHDFLLINDILFSTIPSVMKFLAFSEHDMYALGGLLFLKEFMYKEFHDVIIKWRNDALENFLTLQTDSIEKKRQQIHDDTEIIGQQLVEIFDNLDHFKHMLEVKKNLSNLHVIL